MGSTKCHRFLRQFVALKWLGYSSMLMKQKIILYIYIYIYIYNQTRALINKGICLVGIFNFWDFQNDQFKMLFNPNKKTMIGIITWTWTTLNEN